MFLEYINSCNLFKTKHDANGIVLSFENGAVKEKTILRLGTKLHQNDWMNLAQGKL